MRRNTRVLATAMLSAAVLAISACGSAGSGEDTAASSNPSGSQTQATSDAPAPGSVKLRMLIYIPGDDIQKIYKDIADKFIESHPEVSDITFDAVDIKDLDTAITTQLASNDPPDLAWIPVERSTTYISNDALADINPALQRSDTYDPDDIVESHLVPWQRGDQLFGMPFSTVPWAMFYNVDLYQAAGVPTPEDMIKDGTWTWENFAEAVAQVAKSQNVAGYVNFKFNFADLQPLFPIMYAFGAAPWNDEGTQCTMNSPEMVDAMTFYHNMMFKDHSTPIIGQQPDFFGGQAAASTGLMGAARLLNEATFKFNVVKLPAGPAGDHEVMGQAANVVFAKSKNIEAATDFAAFLGSKYSAEKLAGIFPPSLKSVLTPEAMAGAATTLSAEQIEVFMDASKNADIRPVIADSAKVENTIVQSLNKHVFSVEDPDIDMKSALDAVCGDVQPVIASN